MRRTPGRSPRRGAQAVEFALLLPFLLLLLSGTIDLSQYIFVALSVAESVADGAQSGSLTLTATTSPITTANTVAKNAYVASRAPGTFSSISKTTVVNGSTLLTVTGSVTYTPTFGLVQLPATVRYTNVMRVAYP